jgi:alcohol dehydrogenase class IV
MIERRMRFSGSVLFADDGEGLVDAGDVVVANSDVELGEGLGAVRFAVEERPQRALVDEIAASVRSASPGAVIGIGDGAVLDAAKLAAHEAAHVGGIVLMPCGREPWRAFAPFAVIDDGPARPTVGDTTGGNARVAVIDELLHALDDRAVAIAAIDTAVHAVESLLSPRLEPYSEALAVAALRLVAGSFDDAQSPVEAARRRGRARLVVAAGLAVEAFMTTSLGLAHAIASPLGTQLGITHDVLNGILGPPTVTFWESSPGISLVASGLGVAPAAEHVVAALEDYLDRAGVPRSLSGLGVPWDAVDAVLPIARRSSGLAAIGDRVTEQVLRSFAQRAWHGAEGTR